MTYTYAASPGGECVIRSDGVCVPADPGNADYQAYLASGEVATAVPVSYYQTQQAAQLTQECNAAITGGFTSTALGPSYSYPSDPNSQGNQGCAAASPNGGMLWCALGGNWALVQHTQAQAQQVCSSFMTYLNNCQAKLVALKAQVAAATTQVDVQSVSW
ncbi:hypothetical protein [Paraburkholderia unamae]|uniref:Uncharacterized protein n=1 Tax=Paraburkholderia unamae TaxID=219649 RepID=A0ACC6RGT8_9BURK